MTQTLSPRNTLILVRVDSFSEVPVGRQGLVVPIDAQITRNTGVIEALGPKSSGFEIGQHVLFPESYGIATKFDGIEYKLIHDFDILGSFV